MNIAVTTPTGHVGSAVADFLLDFGGDVHVTLLGRRPEKLKDFVRRGAKTAIGPQDDADYLVKATKGVDALFWATPPGYGSDNLRAFQNRLGKAAATAIRTNKIARVVNLSSIGANLDSGVGPISGLHDVEKLINEVGCHVTHLRPGFFFENLLWQLDAIRTWGRDFAAHQRPRPYPMIATRDIGRVAAGRLAEHGLERARGPGVARAGRLDLPRGGRNPLAGPRAGRSSTSSAIRRRPATPCSKRP